MCGFSGEYTQCVRGGQAVKRAADVLVASVALVLLSPVLLATAILVRIKLGSPVFFRQRRPGRGGKAFELVKFRTMLDAVGPDGGVLPDSERLTRFGSALRSSSLDELPELFNVLKGEMSLVGPRPLLERYLPLYSARQARRHEVLPGMTGYAQVRGRNAVGWEERLELDVWYVENWSLLLDLKILFQTVGTVLRRSGVSAEGHVTMPEFRGQGGENG